MFICEYCGATYEELPLCEGGDKGEIVADTCACGSNIVEAVKCEWCENYYAEENLKEGFCKDCIQDIKEKYGSIENIIDFAKDSGWLGEIKDLLWNYITVDGYEVEEFLQWVKKVFL